MHTRSDALEIVSSNDLKGNKLRYIPTHNRTNAYFDRNTSNMKTNPTNFLRSNTAQVKTLIQT